MKDVTNYTFLELLQKSSIDELNDIFLKGEDTSQTYTDLVDILSQMLNVKIDGIKKYLPIIIQDIKEKKYIFDESINDISKDIDKIAFTLPSMIYIYGNNILNSNLKNKTPSDKLDALLDNSLLGNSFLSNALFNNYCISRKELFQHLYNINSKKKKPLKITGIQSMINMLDNISFLQKPILKKAESFIDKLDKKALISSFPFLKKNNLNELTSFEIFSIILLYHDISIRDFIDFANNQNLKEINDLQLVLQKTQEHLRTNYKKTLTPNIRKFHSKPTINHLQRIPYDPNNVDKRITTLMEGRKKILKDSHIHFVYGTFTILAATGITIAHIIIHFAKNTLNAATKAKISIGMFSSISIILLVGIALAVILELQSLYYNIQIARKRAAAIKPILGFASSSILLKLFPIINVLPVLIAFPICFAKYQQTHLNKYLYIPAIIMFASLVICLIITAILTCNIYIIPQPLVNLRFSNFDINKTSKVNNKPYHETIVHNKVKSGKITLDIFYTKGTNPSNQDNKILFYFPGQFNVPLHEQMADFLVKYHPKDTIIITLKYPTLFSNFTIPSFSSWINAGKDALLKLINEGIDIVDQYGNANIKHRDTTLKINDLTKLHILAYSLGGIISSNSIALALEELHLNSSNKNKIKLGGLNFVSPAVNINSMRGIPNYFKPFALHEGFRDSAPKAFKKIAQYLDTDTPISMQHGLDDMYVPPSQSIELYDVISTLGFSPQLEIDEYCNHEEMITRNELPRAAFLNPPLQDHLISKSIL